jgi:hypothetical protein
MRKKLSRTVNEAVVGAQTEQGTPDSVARPNEPAPDSVARPRNIIRVEIVEGKHQIDTIGYVLPSPVSVKSEPAPVSVKPKPRSAPDSVKTEPAPNSVSIRVRIEEGKRQYSTIGYVLEPVSVKPKPEPAPVSVSRPNPEPAPVSVNRGHAQRAAKRASARAGRVCQRCGAPLAARRATMRFCSTNCRVQAFMRSQDHTP